MKLCRRSGHTDDEEQARLAAELGVGRVYYADYPGWYLRLTAPVALSWRREVAFFTALLTVGLVIGFGLGAVSHSRRVGPLAPAD